MSMADDAPRRARPIAGSIRGTGFAKRARFAGVGPCPERHARTAAAGPPRRPVTYTRWPTFAPARDNGLSTAPRAVIVSDRLFPEDISPPTIGHKTAEA